jgi:hypothetical protein
VLETILRDLLDDQGNMLVGVDMGDLMVSDRAFLDVLRRAAMTVWRRGAALILADPSEDVCRDLSGSDWMGTITLSPRRAHPSRCSFDEPFSPNGAFLHDRDTAALWLDHRTPTN